jgi:hypothetical protein
MAENREYEDWLLARCVTCGGAFTMTEFKDEDLVHWCHEPDCPNYGQDDHKVVCECNLFAHAACCPECNSPMEMEGHIDGLMDIN